MKFPTDSSKNVLKHKRGMAVLVVLTILATISIYATNNGVIVRQLDKELDLLEQKQIENLERIQVESPAA